MAWKIDDRRARYKNMSRAAEAKWEQFQKLVTTGTHPREAADVIGGKTAMKLLNSEQWQIRLSQSERATFTMEEATSTLKVLAVGGHT